MPCQNCGREFYTTPHRISKYNRLYCSHPCWRAKYSEPEDVRKRKAEKFRKRIGKKNPNFRHGKRVEGHIRGFTVKDKGETRCRHCGATEKRLDLHHSVPRRVCPPEAKRDLRNGIVLCTTCHMRWHRRTITIYRDIFHPDEWDYISTLELTGRDITGWLDENYPTKEDE